MSGEGDAATDAAQVVNAVYGALQQDEIVTGISGALSSCDSGIFDWLIKHGAVTPPPPPPPLPAPPLPGRSGRRTRRPREGNEAVLADLRAFLDRYPDTSVDVTWQANP
jgi:hypothetical protein